MTPCTLRYHQAFYFSFLFIFVIRSISFCEDTYHSEMKLATEALGKKDYKNYLIHMKRAVELDPDKISRAYYQYGLARAYAFNNQKREAVDTLEIIYNEGIEAPLIFYAEDDPAFQDMKQDPNFIRLQKKRETHPITITPVTGSVFLLEGAGSYLAASIGKDGVLLVDSGYQQLAPRIEDALTTKTADGKMIKYIINTHEHFDHVGGNGSIGKNTTVIAHSNVRPALQKPFEYFSDFSLPAMSEKILPNVTFSERLTLYFNDEEVQIIGLIAHSEGDSIVYFGKSNVLHMGDNFFPETSRFLYPGTKIQKYFETFEPFLRSLPENTIVLSGHDKPVPLSALKQKFEKTFAMYGFVLSQIQDKKSLDEVKSTGEKNGYPTDWLEFYFTNLSKK